MSEPQTPEQLYGAIVAARGGIEALSPEETRLAHALCAELSKEPSKIDPQLVSRLREMLPPPIVRPRPKAAIPAIQFTNRFLIGLDDERIAQMERLARIVHGNEAPSDLVPNDQHPIVAALQAENAALRSEVEVKRKEIEFFSRDLKHPTAKGARHGPVEVQGGTSCEPPSNVIPLDRGLNDVPPTERYPSDLSRR